MGLALGQVHRGIAQHLARCIFVTGTDASVCSEERTQISRKHVVVVAHLQDKIMLPPGFQSMPTAQQPLTGAELLAKVKEIGQAPRDHVAIACGYVRSNGKPALTAFFEALNAAHGINLSPASTARKPRAGKPLSWNVAVSKTGMIPVSAGYGTLLGLAPEDRVTIEHVGDSLVLRKAPAACAAPVVVTEAPVAVAAVDDEEIVITAPAPAQDRELVAAGKRTPF